MVQFELVSAPNRVGMKPRKSDQFAGDHEGKVVEYPAVWRHQIFGGVTMKIQEMTCDLDRKIIVAREVTC